MGHCELRPPSLKKKKEETGKMEQETRRDGINSVDLERERDTFLFQVKGNGIGLGAVVGESKDDGGMCVSTDVKGNESLTVLQ